MTLPPDDATLPGARECAIVTRRSARYYVVGGDPNDPRRAPRELWIVLHGYGQLAGRFIRHFRTIAGADRVIVAPEALNRFYVADGREPRDVRSHAESRVGATWMTREDREHEIEDQRAYLDAVLATMHAAWPAATPRLVVLGFSQGVATAVRWTTQAALAPDRVIAWAGSLPAELDAASAMRLRGRLTMVAGRSDGLLTPDRLEAERERLAAFGLDVPLVWYDGGHTIDGPTLAQLAGPIG